MLGQGFGLHEGNALNFALRIRIILLMVLLKLKIELLCKVHLENQESVVVQIDALVPEQLGYLFVLRPLPVKAVEGAIVLVGSPEKQHNVIIRKANGRSMITHLDTQNCELGTTSKSSPPLSIISWK